MERKKLFILIVVLVIAMVPIMSTHCYACGDDPTTIVIGDFNTNGSPIFHAPALVPIQAAYYASLSTIMVNFLYDLGSVSVEIENETTGEYSQTTINATQGVHPFLISGTSGHWKITFILYNGMEYFGEFDK